MNQSIFCIIRDRSLPIFWVIRLSCCYFTISCLWLHALISVDFFQSMKIESKEYQKKFSNNYNKDYLHHLAALYNQNNPDNISTACQPKIPLIIHQIWVGGKPLPELYAQLAETWKKLHPHWEYILWDDQAAKNFEMINRPLYEKAKSMSERANILRLEVLAQYGGLYVDIDMECLMPFDELNHKYDFYTGITPTNCDAMLANGIIACKPHDLIITKCVTEMQKCNKENPTIKRHGVRYFSTFFLLWSPTYKGTHVALPPTYFYPVKKYYLNDLSELLEDTIYPESMAIHYWGSTLDQKYNLYLKVHQELMQDKILTNKSN